MNDSGLRMTAATGLVVGAILGLAGTFAPSDSLRALAWGLDGTALTVATALLAVHHVRRGNELAAAGFLVFVAGEAVILSGVAMDLVASGPTFAAGAALWAASLAMVSASECHAAGGARHRRAGRDPVCGRRDTAVRRAAADPVVPTAAVLRVSLPGGDALRVGVGARPPAGLIASTPGRTRRPAPRAEEEAGP